MVLILIIQIMARDVLVTYLFFFLAINVVSFLEFLDGPKQACSQDTQRFVVSPRIPFFALFFPHTSLAHTCLH